MSPSRIRSRKSATGRPAAKARPGRATTRPGSALVEARREELLAAKRVALDRFMSAPIPRPRSGLERVGHAFDPRPEANLVGVGIGRKVVGGRTTRTPCVRFYVARKILANSLAKAFRFPERVDGVPTDVIETGPFRALLATPSGTRPARPGSSIGIRFRGERSDVLMAGTLGALVRDERGLLVLSNNHVLADENRQPIGGSVYHPGPLDGGGAGDPIAKLERFVRLVVGAPNRVDAAVARVMDEDQVDPRFLPRVGRLKSGEPSSPRDGMEVEKVGRTTRYTRGRVTDTSADIQVHYEIGAVLLTEQILVEGQGGSFSDSGDSGSVVVSPESKRAVGLLCAGTPSFTVANPMSEVLAALGVELEP